MSETASALDDLERKILDMLVSGDHPELAILRQQLAVIEVTTREFTGVGFFTIFEVPRTAARLESRPNRIISDVYAKVTGLEHDAGFLLFVNDGAIEQLECFIAADEQWPAEPKLVRAFYVRGRSVGVSVWALDETEQRNFPWAFGETLGNWRPEEM